VSKRADGWHWEVRFAPSEAIRVSGPYVSDEEAKRSAERYADQLRADAEANLRADKRVAAAEARAERRERGTAFMIPQYTSEDFFCGPSEPDIGVTIYSPVEAHGTVERFASDCGADAEFVERITGKWWCRLSAPGYMDATEWNGPFDTEAEAREAIERVYEVDADTGRWLEGA